MDFGDAIKMVLRGLKVKRDGKQAAVELLDGVIVIHGCAALPYTPTQADMLAGDWEIVQ